ncbi:MAG: hypothetical protein ABFD60_10685 [Bryobacteraceae bacterium]
MDQESVARKSIQAPDSKWTRRSFVGSMPGIAVAGGVLPSLAGASSMIQAVESPVARSLDSPQNQRYRAVSWWLTWEDLTWPNDELMDKVRRRADRCAASGVNCCLIFGTHLRWDFMPIWDRLHDLLRFIAGELHKRQIVLFDHHSSVIVHRPRNREDALNIWRRNRHHVPFYPSIETAATWKFNGSLLNDWRMIDVETGQPVYLPTYTAEQFCMNNPVFRDSYLQYVKKLRLDTGIDGLMSDDGIFYAGWQACGCKYCRERFEKKYGHRLPPVTDTTFWGNRRSEAFADWIEMRFETSGDFLVEIQKTLPPGFPFFSCCSSSDGHSLPAFGMSYQDFIRACNLVLLEMVGSTPSVTGTWDNRVPSQLLHLGIAREHRVNCLGIGYGFFPGTAFFVWALNKFLGADCWFSTLKGRLNATESQLNALADDSELVQEGFQWEKSHPQLFAGDVDTDVAVYFSRATRDYYGQCAADYASDYHTTCLELMRAGISYDVVTAIPRYGDKQKLVLSSVSCLSAEERRLLARFIESGGTVIATGPTGHYDQRARPVPRTLLQEFGASVEVIEPQRAGGFPPGKNITQPEEVAQCRVPEELRKQIRDGWFSAPMRKGRLLWRPERVADKRVASAVIEVLQSSKNPAIAIKGLPVDWRIRQYRDGNRWLIHAIPAQVGTLFHPALQDQFSRQHVITELQYTALTNSLVLESTDPLTRVVLHSPDLAESRNGSKGATNQWTIDPSGVKRYFILECLA